MAVMRQRLKHQMIEASDTGLVPEGMFGEIAGDQPLFAALKSQGFDFPSIAEMAFDVMGREETAAPMIQRGLVDPDMVRRYWAVQGCLANDRIAAANRAVLGEMLKDESATLRIVAAHSLIAAKESEVATEQLFAEMLQPLDEPNAMLLVNTITQLGLMRTAPVELIQSLLKNPKISDRIKDVVRRESSGK
jgi:hypothetical protein